jgi:molecular chaperone DnaK
MGTGKEQKITISASTRLAEDEIQRMVKDAELHASDDKAKRDLIEARNGLDSLVFSVEKTLKDNADKVPADLKSTLESAVADAKTKLTSEDVEVLKAARDELETKMHKLAESIYKQTTAQQSGGAPHGAPEGHEPPGKKPEGDVVDAEFEDGPR